MRIIFTFLFRLRQSSIFFSKPASTARRETSHLNPFLKMPFIKSFTDSSLHGCLRRMRKALRVIKRRLSRSLSASSFRMNQPAERSCLALSRHASRRPELKSAPSATARRTRGQSAAIAPLRASAWLRNARAGPSAHRCRPEFLRAAGRTSR